MIQMRKDESGKPRPPKPTDPLEVWTGCFLTRFVDIVPSVGPPEYANHSIEMLGYADFSDEKIPSDGKQQFLMSKLMSEMFTDTSALMDCLGAAGFEWRVKNGDWTINSIHISMRELIENPAARKADGEIVFAVGHRNYVDCLSTVNPKRVGFEVKFEVRELDGRF